MLTENSFHYPLMLKLTQKRCIIVGGGAVAARKLHTLAEAGALLTVIAPQFCAELQQEAGKYRAELVQQEYDKKLVTDAFLVIAATDNKLINRQICEDAPCLCNNITEPEYGNFTVPSSIRQGELTVALATGGMPAFTRLLKSHLAKSITPAMADFNDFLHQARFDVQQIPSSPRERTAFWRATLTEDLLELVIAGQPALAKEKILDAISSFRAQSQNSAR